MSEYWKNHYNSNAEIFRDSPLKQVDRTLHGQEIDQSQIDLTVNAIVENLSLSESDAVADICCGNGLITKIIANLTNHVIAVDFSEKLINQARLISARSNIEYLVSDVVSLNNDFFSRSAKIYMRDAISCLNSVEFLKLLNTISQAPRFSLFFVAGIPDAENLKIYYDNDEKLAFYRQKEAEGKPHIGTWWSKAEISAMVERVGLQVSFIPQNPSLCTAYYRYDCLIKNV